VALGVSPNDAAAPAVSSGNYRPIFP
jgi:hypothetical protein